MAVQDLITNAPVDSSVIDWPNSEIDYVLRKLEACSIAGALKNVTNAEVGAIRFAAVC